MYQTKYGKVIKSDTYGDSQEIWIKELNPLMAWKTYHAVKGVNYKELVSKDDVVTFVVEPKLFGERVHAVKTLSRYKDLSELRDDTVY